MPEPPPLFEPEDQYRERLRKLEEIKQLGLDPYPHRFDSTHTVPEILARFGAASSDELATHRRRQRVAGRVVSLR
ncbi:MAG: hypothetical protein ACRD5I_12360, partial [Candidatus Acidiferrales bacterium]